MVRIAVRLWIVAAAVQLASSVLALIDVRQGVVAEVAQRFPAESAVAQERVVVAVLALLLGAGLLIAALELGLVVALNRGKRWALAASVVLAGVVAVTAVVGPVHLVVASGIPVVAVVVSFLPAARAWFGGGEK
ncbi:hypothetical protein [Lentzea aerocolonigenes]|uniref:hypothetical protein n=1 Tax=Lentzea aerocolonigenes TaxID=68170 RepID=UPI0004C3380B|nr:hypothetical protein [Lentzea aerocolonigenes]